MPENKPWASPMVLTIALVVVSIVMGILLYNAPGTTTERLALAFGYGLLIIVFFAGVLVLLSIVSGKIDLSFLLCERDGQASMSRFQLLIFTFVVALSFFFVVAKSGQLPQVPTEVLTLLGISASTYAVGKGISHSSGAGEGNGEPAAKAGGATNASAGGSKNPE